MSRRVPRGGKNQQIVIEPDRVAAFDEALRGEIRVGLMQDPLAAEAFAELPVVRHVVLVREEHPAQPAQGVQAPRQRFREARRVDQDVPARPHDEIA